MRRVFDQSLWRVKVKSCQREEGRNMKKTARIRTKRESRYCDCSGTSTILGRSLRRRKGMGF